MNEYGLFVEGADNVIRAKNFCGNDLWKEIYDSGEHIGTMEVYMDDCILISEIDEDNVERVFEWLREMEYDLDDFEFQYGDKTIDICVMGLDDEFMPVVVVWPFDECECL